IPGGVPLALQPEAGSEYAAASPVTGLDKLNRTPPPADPEAVGSLALPGAGNAIVASARFTLNDRAERRAASSLITSDLPATGCDATARLACSVTVASITT